MTITSNTITTSDAIFAFTSIGFASYLFEVSIWYRTTRIGSDIAKLRLATIRTSHSAIANTHTTFTASTYNDDKLLTRSNLNGGRKHLTSFGTGATCSSCATFGRCHFLNPMIVLCSTRTRRLVRSSIVRHSSLGVGATLHPRWSTRTTTDANHTN